ncbi:hypothetical protein CFB52_032405 [Burkholderia sp. AU18528]|nr:hypothetical protein CFB35_32370 [Burkholderia sp. AU16482]PHP85180.1 hypothetical protein CFB52_032405 [Burkholderia sp. AU18528]
MRRDRVRRACCGERIAPTANVARRKCTYAVISIDEIIRYAQYPSFARRCVYATTARRRPDDALCAFAYRFRKTLVGPCGAQR